MNPPIKKLTPARRQHGFTLIELLITIAIIGVLSSFALPSFRSFIAQQKIKTASFDMMSMLTLTRSEAIKRNATVTAAPTGNNWANGWTVTAADGTVVSRQTALPGLAVTCAGSTTCAAISFNNNGRSSNTQSIQLNTIVDSVIGIRCISLDLSGRPNSKKGTC